MGKRMKRNYYFYRNEMIERFGNGWTIVYEMCAGNTTGIPIYKAIIDAKNSIDKRCDSTHKAEPRIIGTAGWNDKNAWYVETDPAPD